MAWRDSLQDASFRGVPFQCTQVGRMGARAIAVHEYPYAAGADLEDMNLAARRVRLRAVFFGDDYEEQLAAFVEALEAPGTGDLVHPVHGSMTVLSEAWEDEHDADFEGAILSVSFIEDELRDPVFSESTASAATDAVFTDAEICRAEADDALARFTETLPADVPRLSVLEDAFGQVSSFFSGVLSVTGTAANLLLSGLDAIAYPRAFAADLVAIVDTAFQGLPFAGRNTSYTGAVVPAPTSATALADFTLVSTQWKPSGLVLTPSAPAPSAVMRTDVALVQAHGRVHAAAAIAEAAAIVLAGELEKPVLARNDVEALTAQTRATIQAAIDGARGALDAEGRGRVAASLATLAWRVQEAARAVINLRPPLVQRACPVTGPVRLVAHAMYADPTRADELTSLNQLGRKVLLDKGDVLYAYAR